MQTKTTSLPAPHGPSAADLIAWWHDRSDIGGTTTERSCTAVATTALNHLAHHASTATQSIDMGTVNVEQLLADHADCLWPNLSASTRSNYTKRLRRAVAEFLTALDDPSAVRASRARARLDAARTGQPAPHRNGSPTMNTITELETTIGTTTNGGPRITRIWHAGEHTVRARVAYDAYREQSFALAEVLTPALEWTKVCETAPEDFHARSARGVKVRKTPTEDELLALADDLMHRAARILRVPTA
jgi:hypothetical protein